MNTRGDSTLLADLTLAYLGRTTTLKGDQPGHEFRGNQYGHGTGSGISDSGESVHMVSSGESAKLNKREKKAIQEIPTSYSQQPSSGEIAGDGKVAYFHRIGRMSGNSDQETGNVMRGKDGKHYAFRGGNVFEVARVKPYLGKWTNPRNSYSNAEQ